jgi:hypothetical protein
MYPPGAVWSKPEDISAVFNQSAHIPPNIYIYCLRIYRHLHNEKGKMPQGSGGEDA